MAEDNKIATVTARMKGMEGELQEVQGPGSGVPGLTGGAGWTLGRGTFSTSFAHAASLPYSSSLYSASAVS